MGESGRDESGGKKRVLGRSVTDRVVVSIVNDVLGTGNAHKGNCKRNVIWKTQV